MTTPGLSEPLDLIVGIGNPGRDYANTRHNAGVWFVESLAEHLGAGFKPEKKFSGRTALISLQGREIRLLIPDTFMNESGRSVSRLVNFFKIQPASMLVAHDEIDFPCGKVRFKQGGGLAGHNGLRHISSCLSGTRDFNRLRIGVGHPGSSGGVTDHVLGKVSRDDKQMIDTCIDEAISALPFAVDGNWQEAMQRLHNAPQPFQEEGKEEL